MRLVEDDDAFLKLNHIIIYNKPTRYNSGSIVFFNNYRYAIHVSDALCVHHQELIPSQLMINTSSCCYSS